MNTKSTGGSKTDHPLLGIPAGRDWRLNAEALDYSALRNSFAHRLAKIMRLPWAPSTRICEYYLNTVFMGMTTLTERIASHPNRLNISSSGGGFIVELVAVQQEPVDTVFIYTDLYTTTPNPVHGDGLDQAFVVATGSNTGSVITNRLQDAEDALVAENWSAVWGTWFDLDSCVAFYLHAELLKNSDGPSHGMRVVYDPSGTTGVLGKMFFVPWDFDLSSGNGGEPASTATGWWMAGNQWFAQMLLSPQFQARMKSMYREVISVVVSEINSLEQDVKFLTESEAYSRNFALWPNLSLDPLGQPAPATATQGGNDLVKWMRDRVVWITSQLIPTSIAKPISVSSGIATIPGLVTWLEHIDVDATLDANITEVPNRVGSDLIRDAGYGHAKKKSTGLRFDTPARYANIIGAGVNPGRYVFTAYRIVTKAASGAREMEVARIYDNANPTISCASVKHYANERGQISNFVYTYEAQIESREYEDTNRTILICSWLKSGGEAGITDLSTNFSQIIMAEPLGAADRSSIGGSINKGGTIDAGMSYDLLGMVAVQGDLSDANFTKIRNYFVSKWG